MQTSRIVEEVRKCRLVENLGPLLLSRLCICALRLCFAFDELTFIAGSSRNCGDPNEVFFCRLICCL
jgi:hypothetical protein